MLPETMLKVVADLLTAHTLMTEEKVVIVEGYLPTKTFPPESVELVRVECKVKVCCSGVPNGHVFHVVLIPVDPAHTFTLPLPNDPKQVQAIFDSAR